MKKLSTIATLLLLLSWGAGAKEPVTKEIKVLSYNLCTPSARSNQLKDGKFTTDQRLYDNSVDAVAELISMLDCDLCSFQELSDRSWGNKDDLGIPRRVDMLNKGVYTWVIYPDSSKGTLACGPGLAFRTKRFKEMDSGIWFLAGVDDEYGMVGEYPQKVCRPCVWIRLKDKLNGREFYFLSTHFYLQRKGDNSGGNCYNAENLIRIISERIPDDLPVILCGDFNTDYNKKTYTVLSSTRLKDSFLTLKDEGKLSDDTVNGGGTQPTKDESGFVDWHPDKIMFDGFKPLSFVIDRTKLPTKDGSLHYPSDHCPVYGTLIME